MFSNAEQDVVYYEALQTTIDKVSWSGSLLHSGKVRDNFSIGRYWLMVATDRLSAFDRVWTTVPFKGQILTELSQFWFERLSPLMRHHLVAKPYANALVVRPLQMIPIEFVVRGFITGQSKTSLWTLYQQGQREFDEWLLPEGLQIHQQLPQPIITLSTKSDQGDLPLSLATALSEGLMTETQWQVIKDRIFAAYELASDYAASRGLLLADAKFEWGIDKGGELVLADEVFTPDASRYWQASSHGTEQTPIGFDKESFRQYLRQLGDPARLPTDQHIDADQRVDMAKRYVKLYELITDKQFEPSETLFGTAASMHMN